MHTSAFANECAGEREVSQQHFWVEQLKWLVPRGRCGSGMKSTPTSLLQGRGAEASCHHQKPALLQHMCKCQVMSFQAPGHTWPWHQLQKQPWGDQMPATPTNQKLNLDPPILPSQCLTVVGTLKVSGQLQGLGAARVIRAPSSPDTDPFTTSKLLAA